MCLYPGLCELQIMLAYEIIAVFWASVTKKQECFHRWEEMCWRGVRAMTPGEPLCRKQRLCLGDLVDAPFSFSLQLCM